MLLVKQLRLGHGTKILSTHGMVRFGEIEGSRISPWMKAVRLSPFDGFTTPDSEPT